MVLVVPAALVQGLEALEAEQVLEVEVLGLVLEVEEIHFPTRHP